MKRNILFFAALLFSLCTIAQKNEYPDLNNYWTSEDMSYKSEKEKEKIVNAKIIGYNQTIQSGKKSYLWQSIIYDKNGNCISSVLKRSSGKIYSQSFYSYNSDNKVIAKKFLTGKGELNKLIDFTYDKFGNITEQIFYEKGGKKSKIVSTYDSSRIIESYFYKNGSKEFNRKWIYTYYPDKSKKSSVIYNAAGKVLYTWNYECKPEGELASKHKDTTAICKNEEFDNDSNKVITSRRFNDKGKPYKIVRVFNKENKIIKYESYYENGKLSNAYKYNGASSDIEELSYYNKKGTETFKAAYTYDTNRNLTEYSTFKKGKITFKFLSEYNALNFPITGTYYKDGNKKTSIYKWDYIFTN